MLAAVLHSAAVHAAPTEVCSVTEPVCVELGPDAAGALADAERAFATVRVLGLPAPRTRLDRGVLMLQSPNAAPCERETRIVRAVVTASLQKVVSMATTAEEPATSAVLAEVFTNLGSPCRSAEARSLDASAGRAPQAGWPLQGPRFLDWLDVKIGVAGPGRYLAGVTTRLPYRDLFVVLRENTKDAFFAGSTFADAVGAFGIEQFYPRLPRPTAAPAWDIEWPSTPRALALPEPLAPLGSAALRIRVPAGLAASPSLRIEAAWEQRAELRVAVLAVDARNEILQKAWVPTRARIPEALFSFGEVTGAHAIVLVLTSVGDPFAPLATDQISFEPHGAVVTLAGSPP